MLNGTDVNHQDNHDNSVLYCGISNLRQDLVRAMLNFGPSTKGINSLIRIRLNLCDVNILIQKYIFDSHLLTEGEMECLKELSWELIIEYLQQYEI